MHSFDITTPTARRIRISWGINAGYRHQFTGSWQPAVPIPRDYGEQHSTNRAPIWSPFCIKAWPWVSSSTPAAKWGVALGVNYLASDYLDINFYWPGEARRDQVQDV